MNLAVHGLEGDIQKAISYYQDPHELLGKANTVMANPPFNLDEIDADKIKNDPRLPFGLPGVNKKGKYIFRGLRRVLGNSVCPASTKRARLATATTSRSATSTAT